MSSILKKTNPKQTKTNTKYKKKGKNEDPGIERKRFIRFAKTSQQERASAKTGSAQKIAQEVKRTSLASSEGGEVG